MKCLTFRNLPQLVARDKDLKADSTYMAGGPFVCEGLVGALLSHGVYDRYMFICNTPADYKAAESRLSGYPNYQRAELILLDDFHKIEHIDRMVLLAETLDMYELCHLRKLYGRYNWPATGITHTLSPMKPGIITGLFLLFEDIFSHDSIICTSSAGKKVIQNIANALCNNLKNRFGAPPQFNMQLPIIPLGVDAKQYVISDKAESRSRFGIPDDRTVFLYLGRFSESTKMDPYPMILTFARAFANRKKDALLILAGDDTVFKMAAKLEEFAAEIGIPDQIMIRPDISSDEKFALYSAADVFVSLADNVQETFGLTIIEAMAFGLPVIASDWNGYHDTVAHEVTGFLVPSYWAHCIDEVSQLSMIRGDGFTHWLLSQAVTVDLKALEKYMLALYENPQLRNQMGNEARNRVLERYDWAIIVRKYEELWEEMIGKANSNREVNADPKYRICAYDYLDVFGHYATEVIGKDSRVQLTSLGQQYLHNDLKARHLNADMYPFSRQVNLAVISACEENHQLPIGIVIEMVKKKFSITPEVVFQHVARLLKYGMLERLS